MEPQCVEASLTARRNDNRRFCPSGVTPERGQYGYADHTLRHPHFQVEAVQVNDRVDLLAESTVLPFLEALLQPTNHARHRALRC